MEKVLILGLGISGKAAASLLLAQGKQVIAIDRRANEIRVEVAPLLAKGLSLEGEDFVWPTDLALAILSPGIPLTHPLVLRAKQRGIPVIGEIEFALQHLPNRCIGVTGSNGKTTTVLLTTHVLNQAGIRARALGNVGVGLSSYCLEVDPAEILVIELSSFQLELLEARCLEMALVVNILPNHLDRYSSMEEYAKAKMRIGGCVKEGGKLFVPKKVAQEYPSLLPKKWEIYEEAAWTLCRELGVAKETFAKAEKTFQKPPHRIEWAGNVRGVEYYNDSKSSNVEATLFALKKFSGPIVLIVGGTDKGSSYLPWVAACQGKVKRVIAYGAAAEKIEKEIGRELPFEKKERLRDAVFLAHQIATASDVVLLSPGCSSYDQFRSFEQRGDVFKQIVRELGQAWNEKKSS